MMKRQMVAALAAGVGLTLVGCGTTKEEPRAAGAAEQSRWKLAQQESLGDETNPFTFCRANACPGISRKSVTAGVQATAPRTATTPATLTTAVKSPVAAAKPADRVVIPFAYNSAALSDEGKKTIEALLQGRDRLSLEIVGLADSVQRDAYNSKLAARRAKSVSTFLSAITAGRSAGSVQWSTSSRIVRVTPDGTYPPGETHRGRRVDLGVIGLEVKQ